MANVDQLKDKLRSAYMDTARHYQAQYDTPLRTIGYRAPQPVLGQDPNTYRREVMRTLKKTFLQNHPLHKINMRGLPDDVLPQFERDVISAALSEAHNPASVPLGEMRKVEKLDDFGQVREVHWIGQESFVKDMGRPGRRVLSFCTDKGKFDACKGTWF